MRLDVRLIQPAWFRLLFLVVLAVPFFHYGFIVMVSGPIGSFDFFLAWILYTCAIYALMVSTIGLSEFLGWLAWISVLCVVTIGAAVALLWIADKLGFTFDTPSGEKYVGEVRSRDLVKKGLAILSTVPYAVFFVNSFSAAGLAKSLATWRGGKRAAMAHPVTALRTIQHMTEVLPQLLPIWREEFPRFFRPRFNEDVEKFFPERASRPFQWMGESLSRWSAAMLVFAFEPLPLYCHMIEVHFAVHLEDDE